MRPASPIHIADRPLRARRLCLALLAALLVLAIPCLAVEQQFHSEVGKFTLTVPEGWKLDTFPGGEPLARLTAPSRMKIPPTITVAIEVRKSDATGERRLTEARDHIVAALQASYPNLKLELQDLLTLPSGEKAARVSGSFSQNGDQLELVRVGLLRQDAVYLLTYSAPKQVFPSWRATFAKVLASFQGEGMKAPIPMSWWLIGGGGALAVILILALLWNKYLRGIRRI